jgi:hypothetical protein
VAEHEATRCGCPGPSNVIARQGMCPSCGIEGPDHQMALMRAFAAGRYQAAVSEGRFQGQRQGYERGVEVGRREAVEALAAHEARFRQPEPDFELDEPELAG